MLIVADQFVFLADINLCDGSKVPWTDKFKWYVTREKKSFLCSVNLRQKIIYVYKFAKHAVYQIVFVSSVKYKIKIIDKVSVWETNSTRHYSNNNFKHITIILTSASVSYCN